jgi:hypothetical protein
VEHRFGYLKRVYNQIFGANLFATSFILILQMQNRIPPALLWLIGFDGIEFVSLT